ncbi:MAG: hypothetical protein JKY65_28460 [Planctomycetes bacterium]|nr:hypothetical protein [Planctomycetota bacterium]
MSSGFRAVLLVVVASLAASQTRNVSALAAFFPAFLVTVVAILTERRTGRGNWPALAWSTVFGLASLGVIVVAIDGAARLEWIAVLLLGTLIATARNLVAGATTKSACSARRSWPPSGGSSRGSPTNSAISSAEP